MPGEVRPPGKFLTSVQKSNLTGSLLPLQGALAPDVGQAHHQDADEDQHLPEAEPPQGLEDHGPGIEEDGFNVEHDEKHGDDVKAHRVAGAGVTDGVHAAFVGEVLGVAVRLFAQELGQEHDHAHQAHGDDHVNQDR